MTIPDNDLDRRVLAAEYVLGLLEGDAQAEAHAWVNRDRQAAAMALAWEDHFLALSDRLRPESVPETLWHRLSAVLFDSDAGQHASPAAAALSTKFVPAGCLKPRRHGYLVDMRAALAPLRARAPNGLDHASVVAAGPRCRSSTCTGWGNCAPARRSAWLRHEYPSATSGASALSLATIGLHDWLKITFEVSTLRVSCP